MKAIKPLALSGQSVSFRAGGVVIALSCVRLDQAYRVAVLYGSTGAEVPELSQSYPDEPTAREVARDLSRRFLGGLTIAQAVAA